MDLSQNVRGVKFTIRDDRFGRCFWRRRLNSTCELAPALSPVTGRRRKEQKWRFRRLPTENQAYRGDGGFPYLEKTYLGRGLNSQEG